jgi:hypothetical protein
MRKIQVYLFITEDVLKDKFLWSCEYKKNPNNQKLFNVVAENK